MILYFLIAHLAVTNMIVQILYMYEYSGECSVLSACLLCFRMKAGKGKAIRIG